MPQSSAQHARQRALRIVLAQLAVTAAAAVLFLLAGPASALSAAVGGLISTAGSYYQVRIAFSTRAQGDAALAARALYLAEGFLPCDPFEGYGPDPNSAFFTRTL